MIFQILPKQSVARDLPQTYRQTVPQTRPCNSKAAHSRQPDKQTYSLRNKLQLLSSCS